MWLYEKAERLAIQVHSHPTEAFHSDTDRRLPHSDDAWGVVARRARLRPARRSRSRNRAISFVEHGMEGAVASRCSACPANGRLTLAIPDYFQRNAVAISQAISGLDEQRLEARLADVCIGVTNGPDAGGEEGRAMADLLVRLLARLYPSLVIREEGEGGVGDQISALARRIKPAYRPVGAADNRGGRRYSASALEDRSNRVRGLQELERQAVGT